MVGSSETGRATSGQNLQAVLVCGMAIEQIQPALTAEEWAARKNSWPAAFTTDLSGIPENQRDSYQGEVPMRPFEADDHFRAVAENNAALPDDDPRKITWADVEAIERAADSIANEYGLPTNDADFPHQASERNNALRVAAKLAAILPPE